MPRKRSNLMLSVILLFSIGVIGVAPVLAQETTHIVQSGETLYRIALRYGLDVDRLAQANGIANTWQIYAGQTLTIPGPDVPVPVVDPAAASIPADTSAPVEALPVEPVTMTHTVQRGENLAIIAQRYGMSEAQLVEMNNLANPNLIYSGQQLTVLNPSGSPAPEPAAVEVNPQSEAAAPETAPLAPEALTIPYTVQAGEGLAEIAARYGMSWVSLAQANGIFDPDYIYAGQQIMIPQSGSAPVSDFGIVSVQSAPLAPAAPPAVVTTGRSILVDLSDQRTYAYENGVLVRNVLSSTGLPNTPTVRGNYTVQRKYAAQTMSGPGYYLPDVPYVMYFYAGYALHGTYWHNNFGQPMSHGCVNLPTPEAEWFYNFAEIGTPVHVQY